LRRPAAARVSLGLDQPFAIRFGTWAFAALQGDLGNSLFSGQSIVSMIAQRIPPTLSLMILTLLISVSVAVPLGVVAGARQGSWTDRVVPSFAVLGLTPTTQRRARRGSNRCGSAERADDFAVSGLRERLQRFRAHEAEAPELQDVTGHDGAVRRLADSDKVELAQHQVKLLHLAAHVGQ
jgi:hypothetical protein